MVNEIQKVMRQYNQLVEDALTEYMNQIDDDYQVLLESMHYSLSAPGKRIRPFLTLLACECAGSVRNLAVPYACAAEMVHTYSLIHDDLPCMDNDDLRRGKPTNHKVYGEDIALLAGDGLLTYAFEIIADAPVSKLYPRRCRSAISAFAKTIGKDGMIGGQVIDLLSEKQGSNPEKLTRMHLLKTSALIRGALKLGAIAGGADAALLHQLDTFGENLGLAFQIKDDILDVTGNAEKLGKNVHSDENCNKTTFVTLMGIEQCEELTEKYTAAAIDSLKGLSKPGKILEQLSVWLLQRDY